MAVWRVYGEMFRSINLDLLLEPVIHSDVLVTPHVLCEVNSTLFGAKESYQLSVTQKEVYVFTCGPTTRMSGIFFTVCDVHILKC